MLRFGTDGLRGVANTELTPEVARARGRAGARRFAEHAFLVGRDTRRSGPMLQAALSAGLAAEGARVVDVGVIPTPGLAWLAAARSLPAAMISASHNPFPDNGIKLLSPGGTKLPDALEREVEDELEALLGGADGADNGVAGTARTTGRPGAGVGELATDPGALAEYAGHLLGVVRIDARRPIRVVCDCANGAASVVAPRVLGELGALEASFLSTEPDGTNINDGCGSTDLEPLVQAVRRAGADLGIAFDGDADRMLAVDHRGVPVDGDAPISMIVASSSHGRSPPPCCPTSGCAGRCRRGASRCTRRPSATVTSPTPSTRTGSSSAGSSRATSSSAATPPPVTACSRR